MSMVHYFLEIILWNIHELASGSDCYTAENKQDGWMDGWLQMHNLKATGEPTNVFT